MIICFVYFLKTNPARTRFKMTAKEKILSCLGKVMKLSYHLPVKGRNMLKTMKKVQRRPVLANEFFSV